MGKALVIVESPAKAKTVNRYLGEDYLVKASMGHVRDLPKNKLGVDIKNNFQTTYQVIPERKPIVAEIRKLAKKAEKVILAADPDREGEAISWHLSQLVAQENPNIYRAVFHEITNEAIQEAFTKLGPLDQNKINAQQTRRILDRLVGYLISPLLWKKVGRGLSAGRVQSVALRLICDREKEIKNFKPEEFWTISAVLKAENPPEFRAVLAKIDGKKARVENDKTALGILEDCQRERFVLDKIQVKARKKNPPAPYITSTLQQDAYRLLHFSVKKCMSVAQRLYEGLELGEIGPVGLITYMRTDSVRISEEAREAAREYLAKHFGPEYVPAKPVHHKSRKTAQEAHEAIRPTHLDLPPEKVKPYLKKDEYELYRIIWNRFLASQMSPAELEETRFDIRVGRYGFVAKGEVIKFPGFLALYERQKLKLDSAYNNEDKAQNEEPVESDDNQLPKAREGEELKVLDLQRKQNFTQPPPRYTEATLVKELEARGIGRPSTYAPIISTLQDRTYVTREEGRFKPTELGMFVTDFLVKNFSDLFDYQFTAKMEEKLDRISEGEADWLGSLRQYYELLQQYLEKGHETESIKKNGIPLEDKCPRCQRHLVIKDGRYGRFKACSGYPECDYSEPLVKKEIKTHPGQCPRCGSFLVYRRGKYGTFIACSKYPDCNYIHKETADTGVSCPLGCGGTIIKRKTKKGKYFYGCSHYPKCQFASWDEVVSQNCPQCGATFLLKKAPARGRAYLYCRNCDYVNYLSEEKAASPEPTRIPDPEQGSAGKTLDDQVLDENSSKDEKRD
ncbi:MAG: type I DNA topoisomerase [Acidobacteriota bacterium]|nr:type I DNA topoisomerase [Acidobacteriota bacterium]MDW3228366.1 type I DNA topoisomerase [Acidobacteriota bacterium]